MKLLQAHLSVLCVTLGYTLPVASSPAETPPTKAEIEEAVAAVSTYDYGESRKPQRRVEELILRTHGHAELRRHFEEQMARWLRSGDATLASKRFVCEKLHQIGTDASLGALEELLLEEATTEMACYALSAHRSVGASRALVGALKVLRGKPLIPVVQLVGDRREPQATEALCRISESEDGELAAAAIGALGKIATPDAVDMLWELLQSSSPERGGAASHALLQSAQELVARGDLPEARSLYDRLTTSAHPPQVRRGATEGLREMGAATAVPLFDGKSFEGWEGDTTGTWRVEDGAITAGSLEAAARRNEFLATVREFGDFDLRLKFRITGRHNVNAGVQFRTRRIPNHHEVSGYQADIGPDVDGHLYDESRRSRDLAKPTEDVKARAQAAAADDGWQTYRIRAEGSRIRLWLNGIQTVDYREEDASIPRTGVIALQIHGGMKAVIAYKDIEVRELSVPSQP